MFAVRDANGTLIWTPSCQPGEAAAGFMFGAFEYVKLATYSVIPFVIILTLNVAITVRLRRTTPLLRNSRHGRTVVAEAVPLNRVCSTAAERRVAGANSRKTRSETTTALHAISIVMQY